MFTGAPKTTNYSDPWGSLNPEERFSQLVSREKRVAYFYHTPDNSTFRYRVHNVTWVLNNYATDISAGWFCFADAQMMDRVIDAIDVLVFCRTQYSTSIGRMIERAKRRGVRVLFDVDDMVFDTENIELLMYTLGQDLGVDGPWDYWYSYVGRIGATLRLCDGAIATNQFLANAIQSHTGRSCGVISNFMNYEQYAFSELVLGQKRKNEYKRTSQIHIGYFSGSPSHSRDFAIVTSTLANIMDENPTVVVWLVGYAAVSGDLRRHHNRVEIHPFRDFVNLQSLIGAVEINIVPLQNNAFTNCKSELKYFEAAAVGTVTVASPTYAYRESIADGINGYLANELEWAEKIRLAIGLLENGGDSYIRMAERAKSHVDHKFAFNGQVTAIQKALFTS